MNMKKTFLLLFAILFCSLVVADIEISGIDEEYMFGESVELEAKIDYKKEVYGYFKLSIICSDTSIDYFLIPLQIEDGKTATVSPEPLKLSKNIAEKDDECSIKAVFMNEDREELMTEKSDRFDVTTDFKVEINLDKTKFVPGDDLVANINVDISDDALSEIVVDLTVDKKLSRFTSDEKTFNVRYKLPSSIKSGEHEILFQIEDDYGNYEEKEFTIEVLSTPSYIKNLYLEDSYDAAANDRLEMKPALYDQTNSLIDDQTLNVRLLDPQMKEIANDNIVSSVRFTYQLSYDLEPGRYTVITTYNDIEAKSSFMVVNEDYEYEEEVAEVKQTSEPQKETLNQPESNDLSLITGHAVEDVEESGFNLWKYVSVGLVLVIVLYAAYSFGKAGSKSRKQPQKKDIFKKDEFNRENNQPKKH